MYYVHNMHNVHYFNLGTTQKVTTRFFQEAAFALVQINLKIYSFQVAGKNKIIAKNALLPDIYNKRSASDVFCLMSFRFQSTIAYTTIVCVRDARRF